MKSHIVGGYVSKEELADEYRIELTGKVEVIEEEWLNKLKCLLQILLDRGWINKQNMSEYSLKGKAHQLDQGGKILPEHQ